MRHLLQFGLFALTLMTVSQADAQGNRRARGHEKMVLVDPAPTYRQPRRPAVYQDRDFAEITNIVAQWKHATIHRDPRGQWVADRRLDAWLSREIRQSVRQPFDRPYAMRLRALNDQLIVVERQQRHYGGRRGYYPRKARILDELVELSARQSKRARGHRRGSIRMSFAVR